MNNVERAALMRNSLKQAVDSLGLDVVVEHVWLIVHESGSERSLDSVRRSVQGMYSGGRCMTIVTDAIEQYLNGSTRAAGRRTQPRREDDTIPSGERASLMYTCRFMAQAVQCKDLKNYRKRSASIIPETFGALAPLREGSTWGELEDWVHDHLLPTIAEVELGAATSRAEREEF